jgi:urease gamma subunit
MIEPVSSIMSYVMSRNEAAMSLAKSRLEAEAAVAEVILEAARNIQRVAEVSSSSASPFVGSNIDLYV